MSLEQQLSADIAVAMKAKDTVKLGTFRMLKTALTNKSIEKGRALDPAEELQVVSMLVKQRRDSIEQFTAGNRPELAVKEQAEIEVLETLLPPAASADEICPAVKLFITWSSMVTRLQRTAQSFGPSSIPWAAAWALVNARC